MNIELILPNSKVIVNTMLLAHAAIFDVEWTALMNDMEANRELLSKAPELLAEARKQPEFEEDNSVDLIEGFMAGEPMLAEDFKYVANMLFERLLEAVGDDKDKAELGLITADKCDALYMERISELHNVTKFFTDIYQEGINGIRML